MIGTLVNLKTFIIFVTCGLLINCQMIFNPYAIKYTRYVGQPGVVGTPVIPVTVPGHNGRTPFINNGAGFITQSAALLNNNNVVVPPTRVVAVPSFFAPIPAFR